MNILMICGSLRKDSLNLQLSKIAAQALEEYADISWMDWTNVPNFSQEAEYPAPAAVTKIRAQVVDADGIWIFTPEYNMMIPGGLKNVLDWLSRPLHQGDDWRNTALAGKKAAVSAVAGNSGGKYVLEQLEQLLSFTMADVMTEDAAAIAFSAETLKTGNILDTPGAKEAVTKEADAFLNFIERS